MQKNVLNNPLNGQIGLLWPSKYRKIKKKEESHMRAYGIKDDSFRVSLLSKEMKQVRFKVILRDTF